MWLVTNTGRKTANDSFFINVTFLKKKCEFFELAQPLRYSLMATPLAGVQDEWDVILLKCYYKLTVR